ncbi:MAG: 50S ribosomal protein L19e [Halobacteria archaeon]
MGGLRTQRRMAASLLGVGAHKVWMDPEKGEDIAKAITREDVRGLIADGSIRRIFNRGPSRGRWRAFKALRDYGHRKGPGSRKGARGARMGHKGPWIKRIRLQRARLQSLRDAGALKRRAYRDLYRRAGGAQFRNLAHLDQTLEAMGVKSAAAKRGGRKAARRAVKTKEAPRKAGKEKGRAKE